MRLYKNLVLALLFLILSASLPAQVLDKKISISCTNKSIKEVLTEIKKKYGINFSYSDNLIPVNKKVTLSIKDTKLGDALKEVFRDTDVTYQTIGSQIVLKKGPAKKEVKTSNSLGYLKDTLPDKSFADTIVPVKSKDSTEVTDASDSVEQVALEQPKDLSEVKEKEELKKSYLVEKRRLRDDYFFKVDSLNALGDELSTSELKKKFKKLMRDFRNEIHQLEDSLENKFAASNDSSHKIILPKIKRNDEVDSLGYIHRPGQISFVTPLGTNGVESGNVVNKASFNFLTGYAAGVEGAEFGGLINVDKAYVKGFQGAGVANIVTGTVKGFQGAGVFNVNTKYTHGFQGAGVFNVVTDSAYAVQAAGLFNVVRRTSYGGQFAGFMNLTGKDFYGPQAAGFMNVTGGRSSGMQAAGFMNVATLGMDGFQGAGFLNVAGGEMRGVQVSGFMNVAKKVKGSQIGVFNFADTLTGAQIGFFSYSVKGYHKVELYNSDFMNVNLGFKTGTKHFHNIFAAAITPTKIDHFKWAVGYGFGSEIGISKRLMLNLDAMAWHINEDPQWLTEVNLLNQLKLTGGVKLAKHLTIYGGPTFNVMVSNLYNPDTGKYGSSIAPAKLIYDDNSGRTNIKMWVGYNAGLRF